MLALRSTIASFVMVGIVTIGLTTAEGQQLPSQRYQPVPNNATQIAPPSVHVPPQAARPIAGASQNGFRAAEQPPSSGPASYTFTDAPQAGYPAERGTIMQTSYQSDAPGEPAVPDILASGPAVLRPEANRTTSFGAAPQISADAIPVVTSRNTPDEFAARMEQVRGNSPRIAPQDFANGGSIREEMADFQRQVELRQASKSQAAQDLVQAAAIPSAFDQTGTINVSHETQFDVPARPSQPALNQPNLSDLRQQPTTAEAESAPEISASEFISRLQSNETFAPSTDPNTAPKMANQLTQPPAKMHVAESTEVVHDTNVRPVSAETDLAAMINLPAPSITIETFGPQTVGINKPATFKIVAKNAGGLKADRLLVGINIPNWVDIENVSMTTGGKEITDGQDQARLVWSVDHVSENSTQTMTITAVPRKAEMFDLGVEWTLVPRSATASIKVTQPKLEMNIVGPGDVLYGEQAIYNVTVRNPGTGTAENVTVMLPEALGGERASLGNIEPGSDRNFQVELMARTAGDLNLIATAIADGNLEISADRKLTVRRANLGIAIEGPALKYSGSAAQYLVTINNSGDAIANDVVAALALPSGVKYLGGIDAAKSIEGGLRWQVGALDPGQTREFKVNCQLDTSGDLQLQVGAQSKGDLQSADACMTKVETVADLVLTVQDPKGPLPTGQDTMYEIQIRNRGSRSAKSVSLVMQFSEGIEPRKATGLEYRIVPGQVLFEPIPQIDPGQEMTFKVNAEALKAGTHIFRAQLTCDEADSREIAEGTTRFFGDEISSPQTTATANSGINADSGNEFKR